MSNSIEPAFESSHQPRTTWDRVHLLSRVTLHIRAACGLQGHLGDYAIEEGFAAPGDRNLFEMEQEFFPADLPMEQWSEWELKRVDCPGCLETLKAEPRWWVDERPCRCPDCVADEG